MSRNTNLSRPIVEALYEEALVLADEVRSVFAVDARKSDERAGSDEAATALLALSGEGLKTTTRIMHVLAWLLNQRAFFSGEMSEAQVLQSGTLPANRTADERALALLEPDTCALIAETERLYRRVARLDHAWRGVGGAVSPAISLQDRLEQSVRKF